MFWKLSAQVRAAQALFIPNPDEGLPVWALQKQKTAKKWPAFHWK
jgi:hypothetical protein